MMPWLILLFFFGGNFSELRMIFLFNNFILLFSVFGGLCGRKALNFENLNEMISIAYFLARKVRLCSISFGQFAQDLSSSNSVVKVQIMVICMEMKHRPYDGMFFLIASR